MGDCLHHPTSHPWLRLLQISGSVLVSWPGRANDCDCFPQGLKSLLFGDPSLAGAQTGGRNVSCRPPQLQTFLFL